MARVQQDRIQLFVEVNGKQVNNTIKDLRKELRSLIRLRDSAGIGTEEKRKFAEEAARVKALIDQEVDATKKLEAGIKAGSRATTFLGKTAQTTGAILKTAFAPLLALSAVQGIFNLGEELLEAGTVLEAFKIKSETVFGEALEDVERFAAGNARNLGLTRQEYVNSAASIGDLLIPMRFQREEAAAISSTLVNLSGALSEWTGGQKSSEEVAKTLSKALLGEREELKSLGISINEADIQTRLALKGQKQFTGEALQQAKALATLELIQEKSADAQEKFANNSQSLARQQAKISATIGEIVERFKIGLIPVFRDGLTWLNRLIGNTSAYSAELAREQVELNKLVFRITATNEGEEGRLKLLEELEKTYPGFLDNIDKETASNEDLANRLREVNAELVNKIILQRQEEKIQAQAEEVATKLTRQLEAENKIYQELANTQQNYNIEISSSGDAVEKASAAIDALAEKSNGLGIALNPALRQQRALSEAVTEFERASNNLNNEQEISNELLKEQTALRERLGITLQTEPPAVVGPEADIPSAPGIESGPDPKAAEKRAEQIEKEAERTAAAIESTQRKIEELRISVLKDGAEKRIAEIELAAAREIEALSGTGEQIEEATKLINQRTEAQITIIRTEEDRKRREETKKGFNKELEELEDFYSERNQIVTSQIIDEATRGDLAEVDIEKELRKRLLDELKKYLEARKQAIESARNSEEISKEEAGRLLLEIENQLNEERLRVFESEVEARQVKADKEVQIEQDKNERIRQIADGFSQLSGEAFKLVTTIQETESKKQLKIAENKRKKDLADAGDNEKKKADIEAKFEKQKQRIEAEAAKKRKERAIIQTVINTATSIVKTGAELGYPAAIPLQILAAAVGAFQLATISAQELAGGGFAGEENKSSRPRARKSYKIEKVENKLPEKGSGFIDKPTLFKENRVIAAEEGREWFAPNWLVNHPTYGAQIRELEHVRVRGFVEGGFNGAGTEPIPRPADQAIEAGEIGSQERLLEKLDLLITVAAEPKLAAVVTEKEANEIGDMINEVDSRRGETSL